MKPIGKLHGDGTAIYTLHYKKDKNASNEYRFFLQRIKAVTHWKEKYLFQILSEMKHIHAEIGCNETTAGSSKRKLKSSQYP